MDLKTSTLTQRHYTCKIQQRERTAVQNKQGQTTTKNKFDQKDSSFVKKEGRERKEENETARTGGSNTAIPGEREEGRQTEDRDREHIAKFVRYYDVFPFQLLPDVCLCMCRRPGEKCACMNESWTQNQTISTRERTNLL